MAMLESSDIVDFGLVFCKSCYYDEGCYPLILTADDILSPLEESIDSEFETKNVTQVLDKARIIII